MFLDGLHAVRTGFYTIEMIVKFYIRLAAFILLVAYLSHMFRIQLGYAAKMQQLRANYQLFGNIIYALLGPVRGFLTLIN